MFHLRSAQWPDRFNASYDERCAVWGARSSLQLVFTEQRTYNDTTRPGPDHTDRLVRNNYLLGYWVGADDAWEGSGAHKYCEAPHLASSILSPKN